LTPFEPSALPNSLSAFIARSASGITAMPSVVASVPLPST
jgi:hypothetical protein